MVQQVNYYTELELDRDLSNDELGKKLKAIIRKWRNRTTAPDQDVRHRAEKMMEIAEEAKGILTDSTKKAKYDKELDELNRKQKDILEHNEPEPTLIENTQAKYKRIYEKAIQFKELGDLNETMTLAKQLIDMNPNDWRGWELAGRVYYNNNEMKLAQNYYDKAIQIGKNTPASVYYNLGLAQTALGKYVEAFRSYQSSLNILPSYDLPLKKCNDLLEYMDIDSVLPFFEGLKEERNDSLVDETLVKAYSLKADRSVRKINGSPCFTSKEQILEYIELMEKVKSYNEKPEIDQKITEATHASGKEFDKSKIPVLIYPLIVASSILNSGGSFMITLFIFLLSSIGLAVIAYTSIRPRYEINSRKMEGNGTLFDKLVDKTYVKDSLGKTIVIWFLLFTVLSPITMLLYLVVVIHLIFTEIYPQLMQGKSALITNYRKKGDQSV